MKYGALSLHLIQLEVLRFIKLLIGLMAVLPSCRLPHHPSCSDGQLASTNPLIAG